MEVMNYLLVATVLLMSNVDESSSIAIFRFKRNVNITSSADISRAIRDNEAEIQSIKNLINKLKAQTGDLKSVLCKNILRKIDDEDDCSAANPFTMDAQGRIKDLQKKARTLEDKLEELHDGIVNNGADYKDLKTRAFEALQEVKSSGARLAIANEENLDELAYLNEFYEDYLDVYRTLAEEHQIMKNSR